MPATEGYKVEETQINGTPVTVTTYKIGQTYYCHISNKDPGATIARAQGANLEEARKLAMAKCEQRR